MSSELPYHNQYCCAFSALIADRGFPPWSPLFCFIDENSVKGEILGKISLKNGSTILTSVKIKFSLSENA